MREGREYEGVPREIELQIRRSVAKVKYTVVTLGSRYRASAETTNSGTQFEGIPWDDAREQCAKRGLKMATIQSQEDQAVAVNAVYKAHKAQSKSDEVQGSVFTSVWLGGVRDDRYGSVWYWKESREMLNTTKDWVYDLLADPDGTSNAYLCMNAFSFRWEACDFYWSSGDYTHAYMCEERDVTIKDTYKVSSDAVAAARATV